jgi:hypothetical protein
VPAPLPGEARRDVGRHGQFVLAALRPPFVGERMDMHRITAALSRVSSLALLATVFCVAFACTATTASAAGTCVFPVTSAPFQPWGDTSSYFLAPGGDFESTVTDWGTAGGAAVVPGNEIYDVGGAGAGSLALPSTAAVATTPTICVTSDAPVFRMMIKNNGNLGHIDGQLAVYLNFTGADGKAQQVKIAALKVTSTGWTLSPRISFVQYLSTPLKTGYTSVSFTIKPNDTHGNWQIDDVYVDPWISR